MNPIFANLPTAQFLDELRANTAENFRKVAEFARLSATPRELRNKKIVVIDTNVLLDFWVWEDPKTAKLLQDLVSGNIIAVSSTDSVDELADVISRSKFALPVEKQCEILKTWFDLSVAVDPTDKSKPKCKDRDDQKFLDIAVSSNADVLITKDKLLFKAAKRLRSLGIEALFLANR